MRKARRIDRLQSILHVSSGSTPIALLVVVRHVLTNDFPKVCLPERNDSVSIRKWSTGQLMAWQSIGRWYRNNTGVDLL